MVSTGWWSTDDLGMDAIARRFSPEDAAVMAIRAGADILIFANLPAEDPGALDRIVTTVAGAVSAGRLPISMVEASYVRIRVARAALGRRPPPANAAALVAPACPEPRAETPGNGHAGG